MIVGCNPDAVCRGNDVVTNYKIVLRYDGRAYFGWQRHGSKPTIQHALETALTRAFEAPCVVAGAGRTDRGAHAQGQVASVELPDVGDVTSTVERVNAALPSDIRVLSVAAAPEGFHANTSAKAKTYRYVIWNAPECPADEVGRVWHIPGPLDIAAMEPACRVFVGSHDFASFAKKPNFKQATTERCVHSVELRHDSATPQRVEILFRADGFLWKMVRNLVRAIVKVGEGRSTPADLTAILAKRDRSAAPGTAPASGLYLDSVEY